MLFGKKHEAKAVPTDEIQAMTRRGMSDKDIIKALKGKGYAYQDIERAMLSAMKSGVSEEAPRRQQSQEESYDFGDKPVSDETYDPVGTDDLFKDQQSDQAQFADLPQLSEEQGQPVEELVEGLVEEKWQHVQDDIFRLEETIDKMHADMKMFEDRIEAIKHESPANELETRLTELSDHLDEMDARVGGLERAFKQMLPGLTRNIESLSALVNEMKARQESKTVA